MGNEPFVGRLSVRPPWWGAEPRVRRVVLAVCFGLMVAGFLAAYRLQGFAPAIEGGDAWNYLAAGERLNASHPLYAVGAGDRTVVIVPPYWTVPLLAPPPIAVIWRPLALLGAPAMVIWGVANLLVTVATVAYLVARRHPVGVLAVAILAAPLSLLALWGNVSGFVLAAAVLAWRFRDRPLVAGPAIAFGVAMKLTPVLLLLWVIAGRRWTLALATVVGLAAALALSLIGSGIEAHLDWLRTAPGSQASPQSLSGLLAIPSWAVFGVGALVVIAVSRFGDERLTYSAAIAAAALTSPAFYFGAIALLLAAAAPWVNDGVHRSRDPRPDPTPLVGEPS